MTPYKKQRLILIVLASVSISVAVTFFLYFFQSHLVYFYSPSELPSIFKPEQIIRIGGLVEKDSVTWHDNRTTVNFWVTDHQTRIQVMYHGELPDLFRPGQGIVAEGYVDTHGIFHARQVLAKHDENYRPPELQRVLDKTTKDNLQQTLRQL